MSIIPQYTRYNNVHQIYLCDKNIKKYIDYKYLGLIVVSGVSDDKFMVE